MTQNEISPSPGASEGDEFIPVIKTGRIVALARSRVSWVEMEGHLLRLHTATGESYLSRETLKNFHQRWARHGCVQIHRSFLVFLSHVREIRREAEGPVACLGSRPNTVSLPISRRKAQDIRQQVEGHDGERC